MFSKYLWREALLFKLGLELLPQLILIFSEVPSVAVSEKPCGDVVNLVLDPLESLFPIDDPSGSVLGMQLHGIQEQLDTRLVSKELLL